MTHSSSSSEKPFFIFTTAFYSSSLNVNFCNLLNFSEIFCLSLVQWGVVWINLNFLGASRQFANIFEIPERTKVGTFARKKRLEKWAKKRLLKVSTWIKVDPMTIICKVVNAFWLKALIIYHHLPVLVATNYFLL